MKLEKMKEGRMASMASGLPPFLAICAVYEEHTSEGRRHTAADKDGHVCISRRKMY
jgi:hypothetical protein